MLVRSLSGLVYVLLLLGAAWMGGLAWAGLVALAALLASRELCGLARAAGRAPSLQLAAGGALLLLVYPTLSSLSSSVGGGAHEVMVEAARLASHGVLLILPLLVMASFLVQMARPAETRSLEDWAFTIAVPVYLGGMLAWLILLRGSGGPGAGLAWTLALLALVWINDSGAYLGGRSFGRRPFFPSLSPKKTLEGALTGLLACILLGAALPWLGERVAVLGPLADASPWLTACAGLAVGVFGPMGDLSKSFIKRRVGVKDSGHLIPGHGGVLDRIDSLLFCAPVVTLIAWLAAFA